MIEKILAVDEALEPTLPVAGTTGYDALREIGGMFVDPTGRPALTELVESAGVDYGQLTAMLADLKTAAATETLAASWPGYGDASSPRPAPTTRNCPTPVAALLDAISTSTAATTCAWPRYCPPLWPKPICRDRNWTSRCS